MTIDSPGWRDDTVGNSAIAAGPAVTKSIVIPADSSRPSPSSTSGRRIHSGSE
jgi:hypothetical protein